MIEMTTHERMTRMFAHQEADRVPITDGPWGATVERWRREGMPQDVDVADFFGLDKMAYFETDISPRYAPQVIEETDEYSITTSLWGTTMKNWKHAGGVPEFIDFTITSPDAWAEAKARMQPSRDRVDWAGLQQQYKKWRREGTWISAGMWVGFDAMHSWVVGTERLLIAMVTEPDWVMDMFNFCLDMNLAQLDMVWEAGYQFDEIFWCDDMGYKENQFFSLRMYREMLKPVHKRAVEWAHRKGIKAHLHSCGDIRPFVPELVEIGIDMLNPLEIKAGMNPVELKAQFGDLLAFHGGLNAVLYNEPETLWQEMRRIIPVMKECGGYLISSDHSVPDSVSLQDFRTFVELAKELGSYE